MRLFGPKSADHPSVGEPCPACTKPFQKGDYTTLIPIGPGDNPEEQEKARRGAVYNAVAIEVHAECADLRPFLDVSDLYDVAKRVCHGFGIDYIDPRTGERFPAPTRS